MKRGRAVLSSLIFLCIPVFPADALEGESLYETRCSQCHEAPDSHAVATDAIQSVLQGDNIPKHRFVLSDTEIQAIVQYIEDYRQEH